MLSIAPQKGLGKQDAADGRWISRIVFAISLVVLLIIILATAYKIKREYQEAIDRATFATRNNALLLQQLTKSSLNGVDLVLIHTADSVLENITQEGKLAYSDYLGLSILAEKSPEIETLRVLDENGFIISDSDSENPAKYDFSSRDYFQAARHSEQNGAYYLGPQSKDEITGSIMFPMSRRFSKQDGSFGGVVVALVDPDFFQSFFSTIDVGREGSLELLKNDGSVLARVPSPTWENPQGAPPLPAADPLFRPPLSESPFGTYTRFSPESSTLQITSFQRISNILIVTASIGQEEALLPWYKSRDTDILVLIALSLLVLTVNTLIVREASHRLQTKKELQHTANLMHQLTVSAPEMLFIADGAGKIWNVSDAACTTLGISRKDVLGTIFYDLPFENEKDGINLSSFKTIPPDKDFWGESNIRLANGSRMPVEVSCKFMPDGNMTFLLRNIEQRRRTEQRQNAIYRLSEAASAADSQEEVFRFSHDLLKTLMPAENLYIALYDYDQQTISFPYFVDKFDSPPPPRQKGKGLTEYVFRTGAALLATPAVFEDLVRRGEVESIGASSLEWLGVPLIAQDKTIGVLVVQNYDSDQHLGEEERAIIQFVSSQIAMAIARKQAQTALAEEALINATMAELSKHLIQSREIEQMSHLFFEASTKITNSPMAFISYIDADTGSFNSPVIEEEENPYYQTSLEISQLPEIVEGLKQYLVLKEHHSVVVNDVASAAGYDELKTSYKDIRRFLATPAIIDDRVVGFIVVINSSQYYSMHEQEIMERLAALFALAIKRYLDDKALQAQSFALEEHNRELNTLYSLSNLLEDQDYSLEELLQKTAELIPVMIPMADRISSRITFDGKEFYSQPFLETPLSFSSDIKIYGEPRGKAEVFIRKDEDEDIEDIFWLDKKNNLFIAASERLSILIERTLALSSLQYRSKLEELLSSISTSFINLSSTELDRGIQEALRTIGLFTGIDRISLNIFSDQGRQFGMLYEWCAEGLPVPAEKLRSLTDEQFPHLLPALKKAGVLAHNDLSTMPEIASHEKDLLMAAGIKSMMVVPMSFYGEIKGIVTFETVRAPYVWTDDIISTMRMIGEIFASALLRKQAEETLLQSEERYRRLVEAAPDAIIAHANGLIIYANQAAVRLCGVKDVEELNGRPMDKLFPAELNSQITALEEIPADSMEDLPLIEGKFMRRDGSWADVEVKSSAITFQAKPAIQCTIRDLTDRRRMEQEMTRARELEAIGMLAGGIAHDFNNMLTAILGNISLAQFGVSSGSDASRRLQEAEKASMRAKSLTQQLLTFSTGGAPRKEKVVMATLLHDSAAFALSGAKSRAQFQLADDLWNINADPDQLSQVLHHVLLNANLAMPQGGIITITGQNSTLAEKELPPLKAGTYIHLAITDQGIGIPPENLSRIFDPYFSTREKGSGMGLTICYSIIKKHEGLITAESKVGVGTTIHIYLPAVAAVKAETQRAIAPSLIEPSGIVAHPRILVMDDEAPIRELMAHVLPGFGYEVITAEDGEQAVKKFRQAMADGLPITIALLDLTIPGSIGGVETVQRLKEIDPQLKAIASSGYSNDPVMANFADYGFAGVVAKPYTLDELKNALIVIQPSSSR